MFWDITNDALDSSESLVKAVYDSWVLDEDLATIRERSSLTSAVCMTCRTGFVVAFSCKGRGVCPSSSGRHMARDGRPARRSRHPAGARAAVGDLRAEAAAGLSGRPTPSRRRRHEDLS